MKIEMPISIELFNKAWNNLDTQIVSNYLMIDFNYSSQNVLSKIEGKDIYIEYLSKKFDAIKKSKFSIKSRIGLWRNQYCLLITQEVSSNNVQKGVLLLELNEGLLSKGIMCSIAPTENDIVLIDYD